MFIQRNELGKIVGAFANLQHGFAEEMIDDDAEELVYFLMPPDNTLAFANTRRDELLTLAGLRIAPLQDAVDLDMATQIETANLLLWKKYRIDVNRISEQPGFPSSIQWPTQPGDV